MKRGHEEDEAEFEPRKKLKSEALTFEAVHLPTEIWQLISDEVDPESLKALACVSITLSATARSSASIYLTTRFGTVLVDQFTSLLPLTLQHFSSCGHQAEQVADRFVILFDRSWLRVQTYKIMTCWRACYGTTKDGILYDSLVKWIWKNESMLKQQMIACEASFYDELQIQFFLPMALLASNCRQARLVWFGFVSQMVRDSLMTPGKNSGAQFFGDIFELLDEEIQKSTTENIGLAYALTGASSTFDENDLHQIRALEVNIGTTLPQYSVDQLRAKLDDITEDEFEDMLATMPFPLQLFYYKENILNSHPTVIEYLQTTRALATRLCTRPLTNFGDFLGLSAVRWRLIATLIDTDLHEHITDWMWRSEFLEEMVVYLFSLPVYTGHLMHKSLARLFEDSPDMLIVEIFNRNHWELVLYFLGYEVHAETRERIVKDLVNIANGQSNTRDLVDKYNEALKIPEFSLFIEEYLEITRMRIIDNGGTLEGFNYMKKMLANIFPDHEDVFH